MAWHLSTQRCHCAAQMNNSTLIVQPCHTIRIFQSIHVCIVVYDWTLQHRASIHYFSTLLCIVSIEYREVSIVYFVNYFSMSYQMNHALNYSEFCLFKPFYLEKLSRSCICTTFRMLLHLDSMGNFILALWICHCIFHYGLKLRNTSVIIY